MLFTLLIFEVSRGVYAENRSHNKTKATPLCNLHYVYTHSIRVVHFKDVHKHKSKYNRKKNRRLTSNNIVVYTLCDNRLCFLTTPVWTAISSRVWLCVDPRLAARLPGRAVLATAAVLALVLRALVPGPTEALRASAGDHHSPPAAACSPETSPGVRQSTRHSFISRLVGQIYLFTILHKCIIYLHVNK